MARNQNLEEMLSQPPPADDLGVQEYLNGFKEALTSGNGAAIADMWETPAFVLGQDMAQVVNAPEEVAELFGAARKQYREIGITDTRAEIVRLDEITDHMVMVRVRWPYIDPQGREMGAETSTYTLVRQGTGDWKLRVAVMHGKEAVN
jgi:hypothetical protein